MSYFRYPATGGGGPRGSVRLRPRIFSTFGTTRAVGRQPNAPAAFIPGEIPGNHFQRLSRPQGTCFFRKKQRKKSQVTPPAIDPGTVRLVAQRLNHYTTPGPIMSYRIGNSFTRSMIASVDTISSKCYWIWILRDANWSPSSPDTRYARQIAHRSPLPRARLHCGMRKDAACCGTEKYRDSNSILWQNPAFCESVSI